MPFLFTNLFSRFSRFSSIIFSAKLLTLNSGDLIFRKFRGVYISLVVPYSVRTSSRSSNPLIIVFFKLQIYSAGKYAFSMIFIFFCSYLLVKYTGGLLVLNDCVYTFSYVIAAAECQQNVAYHLNQLSAIQFYDDQVGEAQATFLGL